MYTKGYKGRKTAKGLKESLKDKLNPMKKERVLSGLAADDSYGKLGSKAKKSGKINK